MVEHLEFLGGHLQTMSKAVDAGLHEFYGL